MSGGTASLVLKNGAIHVFVAVDIGDEVDLSAALSILQGKYRDARLARGEVPGLDKPCLRFSQPMPKISGMQVRSVSLTMFHYGTVSVAYEIAAPEDFAKLCELSRQITKVLPEIQKNARARVAALFESIQSCIRGPLLSEFLEDYLVFAIEMSADDCDRLAADQRQEIARLLLLAGDRIPTAATVAQLFENSIARFKGELTVVGWQGALLVNADSRAVPLIELLNAKLLATRVYGVLVERQRERSADLATGQEHDPNISPLQVRLRWAEMADLFTDLRQALNVLRDENLARLHKLVSKAFRLADEERGVMENLEIIEGICRELQEQERTRHAQRHERLGVVLEVVVVILIVLEVVLAFIGH